MAPRAATFWASTSPRSRALRRSVGRRIRCHRTRAGRSSSTLASGRHGWGGAGRSCSGCVGSPGGRGLGRGPGGPLGRSRRPCPSDRAPGPRRRPEPAPQESLEVQGGAASQACGCVWLPWRLPAAGLLAEQIVFVLQRRDRASGGRCRSVGRIPPPAPSAQAGGLASPGAGSLQAHRQLAEPRGAEGNGGGEPHQGTGKCEGGQHRRGEPRAEHGLISSSRPGREGGGAAGNRGAWAPPPGLRSRDDRPV